MSEPTTLAMAVRTGHWGRTGIMLPFHAPVDVELAPGAPGVLVHLVGGPPAVPRELTVGVLASLDVNDDSGSPVLAIRPAEGAVERRDGAGTPGRWELALESVDGDVLHLYALPGTPFPTSAVLDDLARAVTERVG